MKQVLTAAAFLILSACGSSGSDGDDYSIVDNSNSPAVVADDQATGGDNDSTDTNTQEPVVSPDPASITDPDPVADECIDYDPLNDGIGWNGVSECPLPIEPIIQPTPTQVPAFLGSEGVTGSWFCASVLSEDPWRTDWNNFWQLEFQGDQTVILQDGSNSVSSWFYSGNDVVVQWSHNGNTATYSQTPRNFGGVFDGGSHCLRDLPPIDPGQSQVEPTATELNQQVMLDEWTDIELSCIYLGNNSGFVTFYTFLPDGTVLQRRDYPNDINQDVGTRWEANEEGFILSFATPTAGRTSQWFINEDALNQEFFGQSQLVGNCVR